MKSLSLDDIPDDVFEQRGKFFLEGIEERVNCSTKYIQNNFVNKDKLYECTLFMDYVYHESFIGDLNNHGDYPQIEANYQFDYSLKHALSGSYKAAFENLRSCLELTILAIFFKLEKDSIKVPENNLEKHTQELFAKLNSEKDWLNSSRNTPFFSSMLARIKKIDRVQDFDKDVSWLAHLKNNFDRLSDIAHVKGIKNGLYRMNQINNRVNNSSYHSVNSKSLNSYLHLLIETIENIATLLALYNPIILIELPLYEKFGDNIPVGFLFPPQAKIVNSIIPESYQEFFLKIKTLDEEVLDKIHWVESR